MTGAWDPMARQAMVWLLELSLRGAVVVAIAATLCVALRRHSAARRHAVWCTALVVFALLPLAVQVVPSWRIAAPRVAVPGVAGERIQLPTPAGEPSAHASVASMPHAFRMPDPLLLAALAWLAGAAALLIRLLISHLQLAALVRDARRLSGQDWVQAMVDASHGVGLDRTVPLLASHALALPIVAGIVRPRVILPGRCDGWSHETRQRVLVHELAHVRRHDLAWLGLARLLAAVFWFHPLVRFACARLRAEAEQSCDDAVLRSGERATDYAALLLQLADARSRPLPAAGLAVLTREHLSERIEGILSAKRNRQAAGGRMLALLAGGAIVVSALVAAPSFDAARAGEGSAPARRPAQFKAPGSVPLRIVGATVSSRDLADGSVRLDAPEIEVENTGKRTIQAVQVTLRTPGVSEDRTWRLEVVKAGERTVLRLPVETWSQDVPRAKAARFEVAIAAVRFEGEALNGEIASPAPTPAPSTSELRAPRAQPEKGERTPKPAPTPKSVREEPAPTSWSGERVQASVFNPAGAPVVIADAWVPGDPPPPSASEAERGFDRGHDLTWMPGYSLFNSSRLRVVGLRMRYKADPPSHAVTGLEVSIEPGQTVNVMPRGSMWGKPRAMTVQILGVRFADGSTWGSLDSMIDTPQGWIR